VRCGVQILSAYGQETDKAVRGIDEFWRSIGSIKGLFEPASLDRSAFLAVSWQDYCAVCVILSLQLAII
jgi:hypothetical protein